MKSLFSIVFVFKLSICNVALSSLFSKLWFSHVHHIIKDAFENVRLTTTKCQSKKEQIRFPVQRLFICKG